MKSDHACKSEGNILLKDHIISDQELLIKIARNELSALELFYNRYSSLVFTIALKILGEKQYAEKIVKEVFLILWKWAEDFDFVVHNVFTWMILLTRNKSIDTLRRNNNNNELPEYDDEYEIKSILPKLAPEIESLEREYILNLSDTIKSIINSLDEEQRDLFHLVFYQGMDEKMIAEILNKPVAAVKLEVQYIMEVLIKKIIK